MIIDLHESRDFLKERLRAYKNKLKTEKVRYKKIDQDISALLLEIELSTKKLKSIIDLLTVEDYVCNMVHGNHHIALFGKQIHSRNLLIGITVQSPLIPPYIFLNISCEPLIFPHKQKQDAYGYKSKNAKNTITESTIQKRRF